MDHATKSLDAILKSDRYVPVAGVPIFDEHSEYDDEGNLTQRFDKSKLEAICKECNKRAETTGDLSPFGPGHTISGAPEQSQPPIWGYVHNYRIGKYGPDQKTGILADLYVKKTVKDNGDTLTAQEALDAYPRRSIELWVKDKMIDWVALLKRTPQRDLGLLTYDKTTHTNVIAKGGVRYAKPDRTAAFAARERGGKLYYSMELADMDAMKPTLPADAGHDPEFHGKVMKCMKSAYPRLDDLHKKYEMENPADMDGDMDDDGIPNDATPASGNTIIPNDDDTQETPPMNDKEAERYAKGFTGEARTLALKLHQTEQKNAALLARLERIEQAAAAEKQQFSKANAHDCVQSLVDAGCDIDIDIELADFEATPYAKRGEKLEYKRRTYAKGDGNGPPRGGMVTVPVTARTGVVRQFSKADVQRAQERADRDKISYEAAVELMKAGK